jgi:hypothetical protein
MLMAMGALRRVAVVSLCVVVGVLVFGCVGAWGAMQDPLVGQLSGLQHPQGALAVDPQNGETLVGDEEKLSQGPEVSVLRVFGVSGDLVGSWTGANTPAGKLGEHFLYSMAVKNASGLVYVATSSGVLDVFEASGAYVCQITGAGSASTSASECDASAPGAPGGAFDREGEPEAVTVDQATGEVYVFDGVHGVVDVFSSAGAYLRQITGSATPAGSFGRAHSLAVDGVSGEQPAGRAVGVLRRLQPDGRRE